MDEQPQTEATTELGLDWTAAEYLEHAKSPRWFIGLALITAVLAGLVYLVGGRELIAPASVGLLAICIAIFAIKKPKDNKYSLSPVGIRIDDKLYSYDDFIHFTIFDDYSPASIQLTPVKRWAVPLVIHLPDDLAEEIVDYLGQVVTYEEKPRHSIDWLMHHLRF